MKKILVLLMLILAVGCINGGEPPVNDTKNNTYPTVNVTTTTVPVVIYNDTIEPQSPNYSTSFEEAASPIDQTITHGDFIITAIQGAFFTFEDETGKEFDAYRLDMSIKNEGTAAKDYKFDVRLKDEANITYVPSYLSTFPLWGELQGGEEATGYLYFGIEAAKFRIIVMENKNLGTGDVIGENTLGNKVIGVVNYKTVCSVLGEGDTMALGVEALGSGYDEEATLANCEHISSARAYYSKFISFGEGISNYTSKIKNHKEEPMTVMVIEEVPEEFTSLGDLDYMEGATVLSEEPLIVAWKFKVYPGEIKRTRVQVPIFISDENIIANMPAPIVLAIKTS